MHNEPVDVCAEAIEKALSRIGQPVSEAEARGLAEREACECRQGMFALATTRRQMFGGAGTRRRSWDDGYAAPGSGRESSTWRSRIRRARGSN